MTVERADLNRRIVEARARAFAATDRIVDAGGGDEHPSRVLIGSLLRAEAQKGTAAEPSRAMRADYTERIAEAAELIADSYEKEVQI